MSGHNVHSAVQGAAHSGEEQRQQGRRGSAGRAAPPPSLDHVVPPKERSLSQPSFDEDFKALALALEDPLNGGESSEPGRRKRPPGLSPASEHLLLEPLARASSAPFLLDPPPAMPANPMGDPATLSGFLLKKSQQGFPIRSWLKRWFVLDGDSLSYSESDAGGASCKVIRLENIRHAFIVKGTQFDVVTSIYMDSGKARVYALQANTPEQAQSWVEAITHNLTVYRSAFEGTGSGGVPRSSTPKRGGRRGSEEPTLTHAAYLNASHSHLNLSSTDEEDRESAGGGGHGEHPMVHTGSQHAMILTSTPRGMRGPGISPSSFMRRMVSKKKKRYEENGYDLDLAYITPQIIAMGYPSEGLEGSYRNSVDEVVKFFETKHTGKYLIYNLCSERTYNYELFHNRVEYYPFADHNPPPFEMMRPMCESMRRWMMEDEENVVAIHCKAGKGRTGVMIVAYLLHCGACKTAPEAIKYYGERRTFDGKGVTIRSQQRYCHYFAKCLNKSIPLAYVAIVKLKIYDFPNMQTVIRNLHVNLKNGTYSMISQQARIVDGVDESGKKQPCIQVDFQDITVCGDVQILVIDPKGNKGLFKDKDDVCSFWFHTSFIENFHLALGKDEIDGSPKKDKKNERFKGTFRVELDFEPGRKSQIREGQDQPYVSKWNDETGITREHGPRRGSVSAIPQPSRASTGSSTGGGGTTVTFAQQRGSTGSAGSPTDRRYGGSSGPGSPIWSSPTRAKSDHR